MTWGIFILGAVALGALSIGHEYLHGTLSPWLALPVSRWQLVTAKLAALLPLLVSLAILATLGLVAANGVPAARFFQVELTTIGLPLIYGLIVAPWLTMVARGTLGGVVFTLTIPIVVGLALLFMEPFDVFVQPPFWTALSLFAGVGAVLGARTVMRLEALDTHRDVDLPKLFGRQRALAASGAPNPLWALFTKELRLQQLTLLVAALSLAALLVARWQHQVVPGIKADLAYPLSMVHICLGPILAGALASAEERRMGTLEWQVLQPMAHVDAVAGEGRRGDWVGASGERRIAGSAPRVGSGARCRRRARFGIPAELDDPPRRVGGARRALRLVALLERPSRGRHDDSGPGDRFGDRRGHHAAWFLRRVPRHAGTSSPAGQDSRSTLPSWSVPGSTGSPSR